MLASLYIVLMVCAFLPGYAFAQPSTEDTMRQILQRLEALEKRVQSAEQALAAKDAELAAARKRLAERDAIPVPDHVDQDLEQGLASITNPDKSASPPVFTPDTSRWMGPHLNIRGYGDVGYLAGRMPKRTNSFGLGGLDLFITSRVSERFSVLVESVFEATEHNEVGFELERALLQYRHNPHLQLDFGRYHSAIGYYNSAYHHGTWFQTAASRPMLFQFEDHEGLLPIHNVGVRFSGTIPRAPAGLSYFAEIGNGRAYGPEGTEPVQNHGDENGGKSFNVGLQLTPEPFPGLQLGVSLYRDTAAIADSSRLRQRILAGYAVYQQGRFEWLNEMIWMHHQSLTAGTTATSIPGGYSQLAIRTGHLQPYGRFEILNPSSTDPIATQILKTPGLRREFAAGLRFDASEFVALKLQLGRVTQSGREPSLEGRLQFAFTF